MIASARRTSLSCIAAATVAILSIPQTGCLLSPLASRTAAFSTAASTTVTQTTNAYQLVNQAYFDAQVAALVVNYDPTKPFDTGKIEPFIPQKDLEIRKKVLDGLQQYATLLAEVSGNKPITDLETQTKAVGDSLGKLTAADLDGLKVNGTEKNIAVAAITAIGAVLIEHEREHALPGILDKMNKPIQDICKVLQEDIGTTDSPGLADALHRSYDKQIDAQQTYIRENAATLTPEQKRTEIEMLPRLVQAQQQGDQALAATSKCLGSLASAHAALSSTKAQKDSPAFKLELTRMVQNAQDVNGFYSSLSSTSTTTKK